jgi:hypothetical protein
MSTHYQGASMWAVYGTDLRGAIETFTAQVYQRGLAALIAASPLKGMKGQFGDTILRSYTMAGRTLITFEDILRLGAHVTLIGLAAEADPRLGLYSWRTDPLHAQELIRSIPPHWPADPAAQAAIYQPSARVTIG